MSSRKHHPNVYISYRLTPKMHKAYPPDYQKMSYYIFLRKKKHPTLCKVIRTLKTFFEKIKKFLFLRCHGRQNAICETEPWWQSVSPKDNTRVQKPHKCPSTAQRSMLCVWNIQAYKCPPWRTNLNSLSSGGYESGWAKYRKSPCDDGFSSTVIKVATTKKKSDRKTATRYQDEKDRFCSWCFGAVLFAKNTSKRYTHIHNSHRNPLETTRKTLENKAKKSWHREDAAHTLKRAKTMRHKWKTWGQCR